MVARDEDGEAHGAAECTVVVGALGHVKFGGGRTDDVLGVHLRELPGRHLQDLLSRSDRGRLFDMMRQVLEGSRPEAGHEIVAGDPPARTIVTIEPQHGEGGGIDSWVLRFARRPGRRGGLLAPADDDERLKRPPDLSATAIERALRDRQFELDLQPIVDLATRQPEESEALVRWLTPAGVRLPAGRFINAVERAGLMSQLTRYVLEQTLEHLSRGGGPMGERRINVNVAATDLVQQHFVRMVRGLVRDAGVDPSRLVLEFGSDLVAVDPDRLERTFGELRDGCGVRLALDDFSTRRTPLAVLGLPLDAIKLDRSAASIAARSPLDATVLTRLADLCRGMDIAVVGKGIEEQHQLDLLQRAGCSHGQGYLLGRPLPSGPVATPLEGPLSALAQAVDRWKGEPLDPPHPGHIVLGLDAVAPPDPAPEPAVAGDEPVDESVAEPAVVLHLH
jgi:EAL domain-containing protein (putative c-di-GMP-specific phosphodiesterase class I)